jgi:hypothetical protein
MDKQEIAEVAAAALVELDKMEKRHIQVSSLRQMLEQLFKGMGDPKPAEENFVPVHAMPVIPSEFPRLLVSYGKTGEPVEWLIVENFSEWAPYHHWYCRPMSELEGLKEKGIKERPKEDWQRRKQSASK